MNQDTVSTSFTLPVTSSFSSITIYNDINVYITEGEETAIISKNEETASQIKYKVNDGVLVIRSRGGFIKNRKLGKLIIVVKKLTDVSIMGDSEVRTIGELSNISLKLYIHGDGAIFVKTKASEVNTLIEGLGKIEVNGNFKNITVNKDAWGAMITTYK
jgi:hypothetical protein